MLLGWLLLSVSAFVSPLFGQPTFLFLTTSVPPPEVDESWLVTRTGRCAGPHGLDFDITALQRCERDWSARSLRRTLRGQPYTVSLSADMNFLSPADLVATLARIRSGWDPKKKAVFYVTLMNYERWVRPPIAPGANERQGAR